MIAMPASRIAHQVRVRREKFRDRYLTTSRIQTRCYGQRHANADVANGCFRRGIRRGRFATVLTPLFLSLDAIFGKVLSQNVRDDLRSFAAFNASRHVKLLVDGSFEIQRATITQH